MAARRVSPVATPSSTITAVLPSTGCGRRPAMYKTRRRCASSRSAWIRCRSHRSSTSASSAGLPRSAPSSVTAAIAYSGARGCPIFLAIIRSRGAFSCLATMTPRTTPPLGRAYTTAASRSALSRSASRRPASVLSLNRTRRLLGPLRPRAARPHGDGSLADDMLGNAPDEEVRETPPAVCAHYNHVSADLLCHLQDHLAGVTLAQQAPRHLRCPRGHGVEGALDIGGHPLHDLGRGRGRDRSKPADRGPGIREIDDVEQDDLRPKRQSQRPRPFERGRGALGEIGGDENRSNLPGRHGRLRPPILPSASLTSGPRTIGPAPDPGPAGSRYLSCPPKGTVDYRSVERWRDGAGDVGCPEIGGSDGGSAPHLRPVSSDRRPARWHHRDGAAAGAAGRGQTHPALFRHFV